MHDIIEKMKTALAGKEYIKKILFVALGGAAGYAYYYFIGCTSGACPITGNPWISTIYGAGIGLVLSMGGKVKD